MKYLFPGSFGLSEEPTSPSQAPPIEGNPTLSSAGVKHSTLLQLRTHVENQKIRTQNPQAAGSTSPKRLRSSTAPD